MLDRFLDRQYAGGAPTVRAWADAGARAHSPSFTPLCGYRSQDGRNGGSRATPTSPGLSPRNLQRRPSDARRVTRDLTQVAHTRAGPAPRRTRAPAAIDGITTATVPDPSTRAADRHVLVRITARLGSCPSAINQSERSSACARACRWPARLSRSAAALAGRCLRRAGC